MRATRMRLAAPALAGLVMGCGFGDLRFDRLGSGGAGSGGATSSGSGATTTSSHASASGSSSSGSGVPETDCTDGVDNDGDGLTDCEDPDCTGQGFTCVPAAPLGWTGPVALYDGDPASLPSCPSAYPTSSFKGFSGLQAPDAQCNPCACQSPTGVCDDPVITAYADSACVLPVTSSFSAVTGTNCGTVTTGMALGYLAAVPTVSGATCMANGGGVVGAAPPSWTAAAVVCGGPLVGTCAAAKSVCAPPAPAPFGSLCIFQPGDLSCPSGYPQKHTLGVDMIFTDTRGCSACTCGAAAGSSCSLTYRLFHLPGCGQIIVTLPADGLCHPAQQNQLSVTSYRVINSNVSGGSCVPGGGAPDGAVVPADATTVCCQ